MNKVYKIKISNPVIKTESILKEEFFQLLQPV